MRKVILASLLAAGLTSSANAATRWCTGAMTNFYVHNQGAAIFKPA